MSISINCPWLEDVCICEEGRDVQISVVGYQHPDGIPARFCTGLIPAIELARQLAHHATKSTVRLIDPSPIANYCNGWRVDRPQFRDVFSKFLTEQRIDFFFDEAEEVSKDTLEILEVVGRELESSNDPVITDMISRIKESGKRHGGDSGESNAMLYMAAHPFSWLDMYHPLIWSKRYSPGDYHFINLMSKPESRFTVIRKYLRDRIPTLNSGIVSSDHYMTVCNTPCYIPLDDEPMHNDLTNRGYGWCHERYRELKNKSGNHRRALKDFESLLSFLGINRT